MKWQGFGGIFGLGRGSLYQPQGPSPLIPNAPGSEPTTYLGQGLNWIRRQLGYGPVMPHAGWFGGGGRLGGNAPPAIPAGTPVATAAALATISKYESRNLNVPNFAFAPGKTAQGYYQITNSNWRNYGPRAGIDIGQYPNAMSAPPEVQAAVAGLMYREQGFAPWDPAHGGAIGRAQQAEAAALAARGNLEGTGAFATIPPAAGRSPFPPGAPASSPLFLPEVPDNSGALDSKHEVTIHLANAPPGTRADVTGAQGPAAITLRTSYAMPASW